MLRLEKVIYELRDMERASSGRGWVHRLDARIKWVVTLLYLGGMLSVPLTAVGWLLPFAVCPLAVCLSGGMGYGRLWIRSLWVLPILLPLALFNPLYDHRPLWQAGGIVVTAGWAGVCAILLRGLLSMQALLLLVRTTGVYPLCTALRRMGVPSLLTTQLLFVYRYQVLLLQETLNMSRARAARGYGRRTYPLRMWSVFIGQLLLRSVERAGRIHRAMAARGFTGTFPSLSP